MSVGNDQERRHQSHTMIDLILMTVSFVKIGAPDDKLGKNGGAQYRFGLGEASIR